MYELLYRSIHIRSGYCLGNIEITNLDILEFLDNGKPIWCRVEHDGLRYMVSTGDKLIPLAELVWVRYVGRTLF